MEEKQKVEITGKVLANQLGVSWPRLCLLNTMAREDIAGTESRKFSPYKKLEIKTSKKVRTVYSPNAAIRGIQQMINTSILCYIDPGEYSRAYEPGMQLKTCGIELQGNPVVIGLDIKNFFHSIKYSMVRSLFLSEGYPEDTSKILANLTCVVDTYRFLPQGGITSAAIANRYAAKFIDPVVVSTLNNCVGEGLYTYIRYSDNLYIGLKENLIGYSVLKELGKELGNLGWRTHKYRVMPYYTQQKILGMVVNKETTIAAKEYNRMCCALHNIVSVPEYQVAEELKKLGSIGVLIDSLDRTIASLSGKVAYYKQVLPEGKKSRLSALFSKALSRVETLVSKNTIKW